ncbi:hypothetical protein Pelo_13085 [Pelomyxa schiedti]|nr:hypothetical protein Pelo_13085 [Pelomyxa schiedti]
MSSTSIQSSRLGGYCSASNTTTYTSRFSGTSSSSPTSSSIGSSPSFNSTSPGRDAEKADMSLRSVTEERDNLKRRVQELSEMLDKKNSRINELEQTIFSAKLAEEENTKRIVERHRQDIASFQRSKEDEISEMKRHFQRQEEEEKRISERMRVEAASNTKFVEERLNREISIVRGELVKCQNDLANANKKILSLEESIRLLGVKHEDEMRVLTRHNEQRDREKTHELSNLQAAIMKATADLNAAERAREKAIDELLNLQHAHESLTGERNDLLARLRQIGQS